MKPLNRSLTDWASQDRHGWKDQLFGHEASSSMKRRKANPKVPEREEPERQLEALQLNVRQLQLDHDLLKKANELPKKRPGRRSTDPE